MLLILCYIIKKVKGIFISIKLPRLGRQNLLPHGNNLKQPFRG